MPQESVSCCALPSNESFSRPSELLWTSAFAGANLGAGGVSLSFGNSGCGQLSEGEKTGSRLSGNNCALKGVPYRKWRLARHAPDKVATEMDRHARGSRTEVHSA